MLEFKVVYWCGDAYYIDTSPLSSTYLWKDGTLNKGSTGYYKAGQPTDMSKAPGYWKTEQEAQQFLDNWMPRKERLNVREVEFAAKVNEEVALDCSIEHWKQNVLDVNNAHVGSSYCAVCLRAEEKSGVMDKGQCVSCILNNYTINTTNCCKEYKDFCNRRTEENAIAMLNKLVLIRNKKYGNPYIVEEKKMAKIEFESI